MIPVLTPVEMGAVDDGAHQSTAVLIDRAGRAVARTAVAMMGGTYGRRVIVVVGPGNNGADGRVAAEVLEGRGVRVLAFEAGQAPDHLPAADLVIDAAYGTGLSRPYHAPTPAPGTPVLAVDIASGHDGLTGAAHGSPVRAERTVTFAAPKTGLLFEPCRSAAGSIEVADIGLDVGRPDCWQIEDHDPARWLPRRPVDSHKWRTAVALVAGSPGMTGAGHLAARAALRGGAGYVQLNGVGVDPGPAAPTECVSRVLPAGGIDDAQRFASAAIGPGIGLATAAAGALEALLGSDLPVVVDGDGLTLLAGLGAKHTRRRPAVTVLTPHDGEYRRLADVDPGPDRLEAARHLARAYGAVVLLKGPTTVVADGDGACLVTTAGTAALATAGTGDVLAGLIAAFLARGADGAQATAAAAHLHGRAGARHRGGPLLAGDLPGLIAAELGDLGR